MESVGFSGGILTMWDKSRITVVETIKGMFSFSIKCSTVCKKSCWITNVYGPCKYKERRFMWPELLSLLECCVEAWCMGGDFNVIRWAHKHFPLAEAQEE